MTKGTLNIHSENILPIIKRWLYSDKEIFVRELVSNACDAIQKVKILRDRGDVEARDEEFRIDIKVDKEARTLTFSDTGVGMDADEVVKYIAQIAFSGAEEFVSKYQTENERDQFIGHFGLGFYSAYMVAAKVAIQTRSYKAGSEPVQWICDGSSEYLLDKGTREKRGTDIILHIGEGSDEFLEEAHLRGLLKQYCGFLHYPIYLGKEHINPKEPLWIKNPSNCTSDEYLEFYRHLYPMSEDPLFWVHLNVDYPFHLKGILYFPKLKKSFDQNKASVKLFCNRVFVSDNCKDVIPEYLMILQGVIDSPDIPLNVSRSSLQMDRTVRQLSSHIAKKVADSLSTLYKTERDRFLGCWEDVSPIIKLGAVEDEKFYDRVKEFLVWKNAEGSWTTIEEYLAKSEKVIYYTRDLSHTAHMLEMYKEKGIEVLVANSPIDPYLMQSIERKISPVKFQRIDATLHDTLLDKGREKSILDADGKTEGAKLADFVRSNLSEENVDVEAKSLASDALPGVIIVDEEQRRLRDYMLQMGSPSHMSFGKRTFVVNTNNALLAAAHRLEAKNPELAKEMVHQLYELALLSQREMDPNALNAFIARTMHVMEKLATR